MRRALSLSLFALLAACTADPTTDGGAERADAGAAAPACGEPSRSGSTDCAASVAGTCAAGQYCDQVMLTCVSGCTSDANCPATERCERAAGASVGACAPCPSCGNGVCDAGETAASCAADCGAPSSCGDGTCDVGETPSSCPADCAAGPVCGDGTCDAGETPSSCPTDCAAGPTCGDGTCDAGETPSSCPADCAAGPTCGDGTCDAGETPSSCPADCAAPSCGDGLCDSSETYASCPADCTDEGLVACIDECDAFAFFECVPSADECAGLCASADPPRRASFLSCADAIQCSTYSACLPRLR